MSPLPLILHRTLFLLLLLLSTLAAYFVGGNQSEALLQWKSSLDARSRVSLSSWNQSVSPCKWVGITCDTATGGNIINLNLSSHNINGTLQNFDFSSFPDLTTLDLRDNSLFGTIPSSVGNLSKLYYLELSENQLVGTIPSSIAHLRNLSFFSLAQNSISGTIPKEIGKLINLSQFDLSNNNLNGSIPTTIGNVTHLAKLYLYGNSLSGPIPQEIGQTDLTDLALHVNYITGSIPASVGNLRRLTNLIFNNNYLTGSIPASVGNLRRLTLLNLNSNRLSGQIPHEIGMLSSIRVMSLYDNQLIGSIPPSIWNLSSLELLFLGGNQLSGPITKEIGNSVNLTQLDLSRNNLNGSIPTTIGNVTHLAFLYLYTNSLSGPIPGETGQTDLIELYLVENYLTRSIPASVGNLSRLTTLQLNNNSLTGLIPSSFGNLSNLNSLNLNNNYLTGSIPFSFGNLSSLNTLDLRKNRLSGTIPPHLSNLRELNFLQLSNNSFTGEFPLELCDNAWKIENMSVAENFLIGSISLKNCSRLVRARFEYNHLTGNVSDVFGVHPQLNFLSLNNNKFYGKLSMNSTQLPNLASIDISNNNLSGEVPLELGDLKKLGHLDLSFNKLVGEIPRTLGELRSLNSLLLNGNRLSGYVPSSIGAIPGLQELNVGYNSLNGLSLNQTAGVYSSLLFLNLSSNNVEGNFPIEVCNFRYLQSVDLSHNSLFGSIPEQIDQLQRLDTLNISHNNLSGSISSLGDLPSLTTVDVSYNKLEGPIPNISAFRNVTFQVLRNNAALCGNIVVGLDPCPPSVDISHQKKGGNKTLLVVLLPSLAGGLLLIVFLVTLYVRSKMKRNDIVLEPDHVINNQNLFEIWSYDGRFVYENIIQATEEFDSKYCIGAGAFASVYKANLSTGQVVAVKKPHNAPGDETILDKSFESEIRALLELRHRNIVKLYGFCSTPRNSFLVYEYLASGSLESLLNNDGAVARFGWLKRVNVVKGVADALNYMHHGCSTPIIHRDISSKNILLDENYEAHVSDFDTARFLNSESSTWTSFAGTFGYAAPELAYMIKPNEKCDVYSFGIVTLEIIIGKHPAAVVSPISSSFLEAITTFVDVPINDILDIRIVYPEEEVAEIVTSVLKMALSCLNYTPESRPSMQQVSLVLSRGG